MRSYVFSTVVSGLFGLALAVSANAASVTVTGCLEKGDDAGEFNLTHATGGSAQSYELVAGGKSVDLSAHVGHKVEVTGEKAAEPQMGAEKKEHAHDHLKVSSLKHIAPKCP
jgi:hypothetical protein